MSETATLTLTEFLLARIAEDEAENADSHYRAALHENSCAIHPQGVEDTWCDCDTPARVLAECQAKRRIVAEHRVMAPRLSRVAFVTVDGRNQPAWVDGCCVTCTNGGEYGGCNPVTGEPDPCDTLRALASVYADHPNYREEWRG